MERIVNYKLLLGLLVSTLVLFGQSEYKVSKSLSVGSYTKGKVPGQNIGVLGSVGQHVTGERKIQNTVVKSGFWYGTEAAFITSVNDENEVLPDEFGISQNYPNPFNPSTKIEYTLAKKANVTVKVYDILGREVKQLVKKEQSAGEYKINFNASELASGTYFYRIKAGDFVDVKKMILIK